MQTEDKIKLPSIKLGVQLPKNSHIVLSISIGQEKQTKAYFEQMVNYIIGNPQITKLTLFEADTLQRFNIKLRENLSDEDALLRAREIRQKWEKENETAIQRLKDHYNEFQIKYWDDYRQHTDFKKTLEEIKNLNNMSRDFRHDVEGLVAIYANKLRDDIGTQTFTYQQMCVAMREYLFEESAVLILLSRDDTAVYNFEIYRGDRNKVMKSAHKELASLGRMKEASLREEKAIAKAASMKSDGDASASPPHSFSPLFKHDNVMQKEDDTHRFLDLINANIATIMGNEISDKGTQQRLLMGILRYLLDFKKDLENGTCENNLKHETFTLPKNRDLKQKNPYSIFNDSEKQSSFNQKQYAFTGISEDLQDGSRNTNASGKIK